MGMMADYKICQNCEYWQQLGDSSDGKCLRITDYEAYRKFSNYCKAYKGAEDGKID
jgi:hypothetical protein